MLNNIKKKLSLFKKFNPTWKFFEKIRKKYRNNKVSRNINQLTDLNKRVLNITFNYNNSSINHFYHFKHFLFNFLLSITSYFKIPIYYETFLYDATEPLNQGWLLIPYKEILYSGF